MCIPGGGGRAPSLELEVIRAIHLLDTCFLSTYMVPDAGAVLMPPAFGQGAGGHGTSHFLRAAESLSEGMGQRRCGQWPRALRSAACGFLLRSPTSAQWLSARRGGDSILLWAVSHRELGQARPSRGGSTVLVCKVGSSWYRPHSTVLR